jgi:MFS family permease
MAMSQSVLMPIYANQILGGEERTLGILLGSAGLGALAGSLYLAARKSVLGLGRVIVYGSVGLGVAMIVLSQSSYLAVSIVALLIAGASLLMQAAASNTLLQTIVEEDKRGRVMSLFAMAFMGMAPFGSLLAGSVATEIGIRWTLALAGLVCIAAGGAFALHLKAIRPLIRPIYIAMGILPNVVADPAAATDMPAAELAALSEAGAVVEKRD